MKKQDILTSIGILLGGGFIFFSISEGEVGANAFFDLLSIYITIGGSFSALLITFPLDEIKLFLTMTKNSFINPTMNRVELITRLKEISIKARKNGNLSIEADIEGIDNEFLKKGLELVVDGIENSLIEEILNNNISEVENRYSKGARMYKTWGSFAPAFGMIGTLIGLIQMLAKLDNADVIASGMAKALITTFYGAILANCILNPIGFNLENKGQKEVENKEMMLVGILSIKNGESTRVLEERLISFLTTKEKKKYEQLKDTEKKVEINAA